MEKFDIVFEGGGAKGATFVGALEVLFDRCGYKPRRVIGTSAGAITATLVAAGYDSAALLEAVTELGDDGKPRFSSFMDTPRAEDFSAEEKAASLLGELLNKIDLPLVPEWIEKQLDGVVLDQLLKLGRFGQIFSFVERGGLYSGAEFLDWIEKKLAKKGIAPGDDLETFHQTFKETGRELSLVASDTTDGEMLILNHRTAPKVPVSQAVRMSMSIPFVWQEVIWKEDWGEYQGHGGEDQGQEKTGNVIVDGGLLSNFPIRLVSRPRKRDHKEQNEAIMGQTESRRGAEVLGLLIDETLEVKNEPALDKKQSRIRGARTVQRIGRMVDTMSGSQDKEMIRFYRKKICRLPAKGYGTLEFDLEGSRLENFLQSGRDAMTAHLESRGLLR